MPTCRHCSQAFETTKEDLAFYDKVSPVFHGEKVLIPPPTLCPDCRRQRRFSFRNERSLYHRKCDLTGKQIISSYAIDAVNPAYEKDVWWSDRWNPLSYGRPIDFTRTFFDQYLELQNVVPQLALNVWNSENSDYCNYVGHVKDSYLIFGSVYSQDCYYGSPYYSENCVDTLLVRECTWCFECVDCRKLNHCFYCRDCHNCNDLLYCYDMQGCHDCIGCAGLRKKEYCILNEQLTREEYERRKSEINLNVPATHKLLSQQLEQMSFKIPHRFMQSAQVEDVSGNYIYECQRVLDSYYADRSQDCRYCIQVVDLKDCYDLNYTEENELCYEYLGSYQNQRLLFSRFCNRVSDALYCDSCFTSKNLFGCIGLRNAEYCILNTQYSKAEYEELVPRIIEHMRKDGGGEAMNPSASASLRTSTASGSWGEFFPSMISPFGYNETVAQEYFPMTEAEAKAEGWKWRTEDSSQEKYLGPAIDISKPIAEIPDDICEKILLCEVTRRPYKIIPQELKFYREMKLPLPRKCPDQRHRERMDMRNPRHLWSRTCDKCGKGIETSYSPERPEIVYCESCYLSSMY